MSQNKNTMGIKHIIGRKEEKRILNLASRSSEPEFIAVYGRRRVGKTHLVREFFDETICFEITGKHDVTLEEQLENFAQALGRAMKIGVMLRSPSSWSEAFLQLIQFLESPDYRKKKGKGVVFLDELPWLNTPRSRFLSSLEHFWNSWCSRQRDFVLVVCGSAASWMLQNVVRAKGGLHNRLTRRIRLLPFSLLETEVYLKYLDVNLTRFQIAELYMAIGGVPHYLKQAEPGLSTAQIIDRACFSSQGFLWDEFDKLYASLFENSEQHKKIVTALANKHSGLSRSEILKATGLQSGGSVSLRLEELEESGFIQSRVPFGKTSNDVFYGLCDEYSQFYFDWIKKLGRKSPGEGHWLLQQASQSRKIWSGYAFENLCIKHISTLKASLGIANVHTTEAPWRYKPKADSVIPGAQIDLLIDRQDNTINLCEMKFSESEFIVDKGYAGELKRKIDVFKRITGTRKNVFLTMVSPYGVADNAYAKELVSNSLTLENLFEG